MGKTWICPNATDTHIKSSKKSQKRTCICVYRNHTANTLKVKDLPLNHSYSTQYGDHPLALHIECLDYKWLSHRVLLGCSKNKMTIKSWQRLKAKENLISYWWEPKMPQPLWKLAVPSQVKHWSTLWLTNAFFGKLLNTQKAHASSKSKSLLM